MSERIQPLEKVVDRRKAHGPLAEDAARNHFGLELYLAFRDGDHLTHADLPAGTHQGLPSLGFRGNLASEQQLHPAAQKLFRRRIVRA